MMNRWTPAHWIGKSTASDEHLVALSNGAVVRTLCVRQMDEPTRHEELRKVVPVISGQIKTMGHHNADSAGGMAGAPPPLTVRERSEQLEHDEDVDPGGCEGGGRAQGAQEDVNAEERPQEPAPGPAQPQG